MVIGAQATYEIDFRTWNISDTVKPPCWRDYSFLAAAGLFRSWSSCMAEPG